MSDLAREFGEVLQSWLRSKDAATQSAISAALNGLAAGAADPFFVTAWDYGPTHQVANGNVLSADLALPAGVSQVMNQGSAVATPNTFNKCSLIALGILSLLAPTLTAAALVEATLQVTGTSNGNPYASGVLSNTRTVSVGESGGRLSLATFVVAQDLDPETAVGITLNANVPATGWTAKASGATSGSTATAILWLMVAQ